MVYLALSLTASLYLMKVDLQKSDSLRYSLHIFYTLWKIFVHNLWHELYHASCQHQMTIKFSFIFFFHCFWQYIFKICERNISQDWHSAFDTIWILPLSLSLSHTHARAHVSAGYWFEWLTCQEFEEPSSMLERCNDELKKVYVGYKQHALYLSIFLYSRPQAGGW